MPKKVIRRIAKSAKRVADGRPLPRKWLEQAAASYDPEKYAARINMEHLLSWHPESTFRVYGNVLALSTEDAPNGELYLNAEIEPHPDLEAHWKNGQKRAFSIEIDPDFADVGGAYLTGLAVTDEPASLGTHFSSDPDTTEQNREKFYFDPAEAGDNHSQEFTMTKPSETPPDKTKKNVETPEAFARSLEHFSTELAALRTERDTLKAEWAEEKAAFTQQLADKEQELVAAREELATGKSAFTVQLEEKDAEIEALKGQVPHKNYKPRPLQSSSAGDGERVKARI